MDAKFSVFLFDKGLLDIEWLKGTRFVFVLTRLTYGKNLCFEPIDKGCRLDARRAF